MEILKNKRAFSIILLILIIGTGFLIFSKNIDLSDGIGFGRGQADGRMYVGLAKLNFRNQHFIDSIYWIFFGSKTIIDSEIKWNKVQPYIKQYNALIEQGKLNEALDVCAEIDELIKKYAWDYGTLHDCYLLGQRLD